MLYYLVCPKCGCKDLEMDVNSHYVCKECGRKNDFDELNVEED